MRKNQRMNIMEWIRTEPGTGQWHCNSCQYKNLETHFAAVIKSIPNVLREVKFDPHDQAVLNLGVDERILIWIASHPA